MQTHADFVSLGEIARGQLGMQCQYASRYVNGFPGYPNLGEGLRFLNLDKDWHEIQIHKDDVPEFVRRMQEHRRET